MASDIDDFEIYNPMKSIFNSLPYIGTLKDPYGANNAKNRPQMNKINTDFIFFTSDLSYLSVVILQMYGSKEKI